MNKHLVLVDRGNRSSLFSADYQWIINSSTMQIIHPDINRRVHSAVSSWSLSLSAVVSLFRV